MPMNTMPMPAEHEVAGDEREDEHVGRDEEPEPDVVPVRPRDRDELERRSGSRGRRTAAQPEVPAHVEQPACTSPRVSERDHERDDDGDREHEHDANA